MVQDRDAVLPLPTHQGKFVEPSQAIAFPQIADLGFSGDWDR